MAITSISRILHITLILVFLALFSPFSSADDAYYFYDGSGRLSMSIKGTTGLTYQYDEVGNLLSIGNTDTIGTEAPVLNSVNPSLLFIGTTTSVTISGQNLFTTKTVSSDPDTSFLAIKVLNVTDTAIRANITVPSGATAGTTVNIKVTTLYGSKTIPVTLTSSKIVYEPGQLALAPGSSGAITVSINPAVANAITITTSSSNPTVASVPPLVTIPANGTATITVSALKEGVANISSGSSRTVIFVTPPFSPEPGEEVINRAGPVSVYFEASESLDTATSSMPVSVYIESPASLDTATTSMPISVQITELVELDMATSSIPVSIYIEAPTTGSTATSSLPASIYIDTAATGSHATSSLPVSLYIDGPTGNSTVAAPPVGVKIEP